MIIVYGILIMFSLLLVFLLIFSIFDHKNFELIEDWKECNCLRCRIKRFKMRYLNKHGH